LNIPANSPNSVTNTAKAFGGGDTTHTNLATAATGADTVSVVQVPASVTATAGTPQSTAINTPFPTNLQVTVQDAGHLGVPNVSVTFQAPASGPSGTFGSPCNSVTCVVATNAMGVATVPTVTANGTAGSYQVNGTVTSFTPAVFALTNVAPPSITKTFGAPSIPLGATTTLSFTITNPNANVQLTSVGFFAADVFPAGLVVSTPANVNNACGGTVTAVAGSGSVNLTGVTLAGGASCTLSLNVTGTTSGIKNNSVQVSSGNALGNTSNASLAVFSPPTITKAFSPAIIPLNGITTVSFTIGNPNGSALHGIAFSDNLPGALVVAGNPNVNNTCSGTVTAAAGTSVISLSAGSVTAASCTLTVDLKGTAPGVTNNTTGPITSTEGGTGMASNIATVDIVGPPSITKTIATPFGAGSINEGDTSVVSFTVSNPNSISLTGLSFADPLPTGLSIQNPNGLTNTCGGTVTAVPGTGTISLTGGIVAATSTCAISVNVTGVASGDQTNPSVTLTSNEAPSATSAPASVFVDAWWLWFFY
jgi:hypothetical protein